MSRLVAIETATEACSVALGDGEEVIERFELAPLSHSALVMPMLRELLAEAGWTLGSLEGVAFGQGPGGFTGVRVAVSTAQGLALALRLPVFPVSSLRALALGASHRRVLAAFDARKGEVYFGAFARDEAGTPRPLGPERVARPEAVTLPELGEWFGAGTGWGPYGAIWAAHLGERLVGAEAGRYPHAADVLRIAQGDFAAGRGLDAVAVEPAYIRPSQAEEGRK